jgi:hypothetical protein
MSSTDTPTAEAASGRRDGLFGLGVTAVSLAAAVSSYAGLDGLALLAGWNPRLALLLPLTIDAYALTATRVWLSKATRSIRARRWAKVNAIGAIATSIAGNAVYHAAAAHVFTPGWPVVVAVSGIPSIVLGLIVHMWHLATTPDPKPAADAPADRDTSDATGTPAPTTGSTLPTPPPNASSTARAATASGTPAPKPTGTRKSAPAKKRTGKATGSGTAAQSDAELLDAARLLGAELGAMPTATRLVKTFGVGTGRAKKLAAILAAEPVPTDAIDTAAPIADDATNESTTELEANTAEVPVSA